MSDNRITARLSDDLLRSLDKSRSALYMTRQEYVRYCVQFHLSKEAESASKLSLKHQLEVKSLRKQLASLELENRRLIDYIS